MLTECRPWSCCSCVRSSVLLSCSLWRAFCKFCLCSLSLRSSFSNPSLCSENTKTWLSNHQTANYCMDSIYTMFEKFENKHFRWITFATLPFYEPFLYILLNTTLNPPPPPTIVFLHLSVSRSVSCFCRASTFPCSSAFMSSSDWSFCLRSCSDLCSLWVTKYEEERQFKGM